MWAGEQQLARNFEIAEHSSFMLLTSNKRGNFRAFCGVM